MSQTVWLNGEFVARERATVDVYDGGWLHGAGLFETVRAENGRPFRYEAHVDRLLRSAETLLQPISREALPSERELRDLLDRNHRRNARVRLTVSAGTVKDAEDGHGPSPHVCATCAELHSYPTRFYDEGITVAVSRYLQSPTDPLAGHKTTCYLGRLRALRDAQQLRCLEAVWFTTDHRLAEGSISNVFLVRDDVVKTPSLDTPVLPGITRAIVLDLSRSMRMNVVEDRLTIDDLLGAQEVFLTNAIMQVMPVIRIEKHDVGDGRPGSTTKRLLEAYRALVMAECAS